MRTTRLPASAQTLLSAKADGFGERLRGEVTGIPQLTSRNSHPATRTPSYNPTAPVSTSSTRFASDSSRVHLNANRW